MGAIGQTLAMPIGRGYDEARDLVALTRTWRECAWIDDSDRQAEGLRLFLSTSDTLVADVRDEVEAAVNRTRGSFRYDDTDVGLATITGVITSRVGRHQGAGAPGVGPGGAVVDRDDHQMATGLDLVR